MSTVTPLARAYSRLCPLVLERLVAQRAALDPSLGRLDDDSARSLLGSVLANIGTFVASGDLGSHRAFLHTFLAIRQAEAQTPAATLALLVAICDTAARVADEDAAPAAQSAPEQTVLQYNGVAGRSGGVATADLALLLARVTASTARTVNDLIADQMMQRLDQHRELTARAGER